MSCLLLAGFTYNDNQDYVIPKPLIIGGIEMEEKLITNTRTGEISIEVKSKSKNPELLLEFDEYDRYGKEYIL